MASRVDMSSRIVCLAADSKGLSSDVNLFQGTDKETIDCLGYRGILVCLDARPNTNSSLDADNYIGAQIEASDSATTGFETVGPEYLEFRNPDADYVFPNSSTFMRIQAQSAVHQECEVSVMTGKRYIRIQGVEVGTVSGNIRFGVAVLGVDPSLLGGT